MRTRIGSIFLLSLTLALLVPAAHAQVRELTISLQDRLWVLQSMRTALNEKYTLADFKTERSGVTVDARLDRCVDEEKRASNGNLDFIDRLRRCIAGFEDFHVYLKEQSPRPTLTTGISLGRAGARFFVIAAHPGILKGSLTPNLAGTLRGKEVVEIDGLPVARLVSLHSLYVNGGTAGARTLRALENLTNREWLYPKSTHLALKFADGTSARLKWWSVEPVQRADAREYLKKVGIPSLVTLDPEFTGALKNLKGFEGSHPWLPLERAGLSEFLDKDGRVGLRIGIITHEGKKACYAQISSFDAKQWRTGAATLNSFVAPFRAFLPVCETKGFPLIFDLRANNGGDPAHTLQLMALLLGKGKYAPGILTSGKLTRHYVEVVSKMSLGDGWPTRPRDSYPLEMLFDALEGALAKGLKYIPFASSGNIEGEGVYTGPLTTLFSPACGSACELMLDLLRVAGRSKFIGTHANGSGGGTQLIGGEWLPVPDWRDDRFGTITLKMPNMLLVVNPRLVREKEYFQDFSWEHNRENRPFQAGSGELFEPTTGEPGREWLDRAFRDL